MKTLAAVFLSIGVQSLVGCTYVPGVEPTDMSAIRGGTATQTEIELVLGEPSVSWKTNEGSINVYVYDLGAEGRVVGLNPGNGCGSDPVGCLAVALLIQPFVWASTPFLYANKVDEQEGYLTITYDQEGHILAYTTLSNAEENTPEVAYRRHVASSASAIEEESISTNVSASEKYDGRWVAADGPWEAELQIANGRYRLEAWCNSSKHVGGMAAGTLEREGRIHPITLGRNNYRTTASGYIPEIDVITHRNYYCPRGRLIFERVG